LFSCTGKKIKLLHLAPERFFYDFFRSCPGDISPKDFGAVEIKKMDICSLPFGENFFDVILCSHVLEHIPNDLMAMKELRRVLGYKGWMVLQIPQKMVYETFEDFSITSSEGRKHAFGQEDHVRRYGLVFKDRLKSVGLDVVVENFISDFTEDEIKIYGLNTELIYFCRKIS
jgi:SAM-dependent methyltransferase